MASTLGDFLCIPTPNTGQLNPVFHTFAEFRPIVNRIVARQSTDWLAANAQFSPNGNISEYGWDNAKAREKGGAGHLPTYLAGGVLQGRAGHLPTWLGWSPT